MISSLIRNFLNIIVRGFIEHPLISRPFSPEVLLYVLRLILALGYRFETLPEGNRP